MSKLLSLIHDVETGIDECRNRLDRLGEARGMLQEQWLYLLYISQSFSSLVKAAAGGIYSHEFFGDLTTLAEYYKRLRAVVRNLPS